MKILAVDDDPAALETIASALNPKGHEVVTARDGEEATRALFKGSFRVVIAGRTMPGMDGLELCRWIRSRAFHSYVFVIVLSKRAKTADIIEGLTAGADEFLSKPIDPAELELRVSAAQRILSNEYHRITIFALAKLAESRDPETGLHLDRIREYSMILGVGLSEREKYRDVLSYAEIESISCTSVLHDIGKVGIPDTILLKPGTLDPKELEIMKTHTIIGGKALGQALAGHPEAQFLEVARNIAFWHHERFDGSGYPHGLAGDDIPICARIVALADVYDAITSKRPYKEAYPPEAAHEIILGKLKEHFDPDVLAAYTKSNAAFAEVAARLAAVDPREARVPAAASAGAR